MSPAKLFCRCLPLFLAFAPNLILAASVQLAWNPNPETDISGYSVYRTKTPGAGFVKINSGLTASAAFTDSTVLPGNIYYYIITAVNMSGLESSFSSQVQAVVPALPQTNNPPTAAAGNDKTVTAGTVVTLVGYGSDPDGDPVSFSWSQYKGPVVSMQGANTKTMIFTAPSVTVTTSLGFRLTVSDGRGGVGTNDVGVSVQPSTNLPPTVNAGADQTASKGQKVSLKGSASDPNADALTYSWSQVSGTKVTLSGATTTTASFAAPSLTSQTDLVFRFKVTDSKGASAGDDAKVTVLKNSAPRLMIAPQTRVLTGDSVTLIATAIDEDGDPLAFSWQQVSGPSVSLQGMKQPTLGFQAPGAETEMVFRIAVSDPMETVDGEVSVLVRRPVPLVLPVDLSGADPFFSNSFVGIAFLNVSETARTLAINAVDEQGGSTPLQGALYQAGGQNAFLADSLAGLPTDAVSIRAEALDESFRGFFLIGDFNTERLDGVGGELASGLNLVFPAAVQSQTERTLFFLSNPDQVKGADVRLQRVDSQGMVAQEVALALPAGSARLATLGELFGNAVIGGSAYVRLVSSIPAQGLELVASQENFSSSAALEPMPVQTLWTPHYVLGREGEDTEFRFINGDWQNSVALRLTVYTDTGDQLATSELSIPAGGMSVNVLSELVGSGAIPPSSPFISGHMIAEVTGAAGQANVVGTVRFTGRLGKAKSMLPMWREPQTETLFMHVAQSAKSNVFTGLVVMNPNANAASVTIQAFNEMGVRTAEKTVQVPSGRRVVDLLDGANIFGGGFSQVGGHLKVTSDEPVVSFAMFGDYTGRYLAAVEGQKGN